jgi:flagellar M-ring protein FliF
MEANHARRIQDILEPIVGRGNVRAQVTADVDFSQTESTAETYKPNQGTAPGTVRSQRLSEAGSGAAGVAQGIAGAASNQPGGAAAPSALAPSGSSARKETSVSYEVDRTVSHTRQPVGNIRRLSAAVVVNHRRSVNAEGKASFTALSADEVAQITALAKEAMGYSQPRGDSLNVTNAAFSVEEREPIPEVAFWQQPENISLAKDAGKSGAVGLLVLYLLFGVLRPLFRQIGEAAEAVRNAPRLESAQLLDVSPLPTADNRLESVRQLARPDPKIVANVVRNWVSKE